MRFCCLGSGSRGNAFLVERGSITLLVECGFSASALRRRLHRYFVAPQEIDAVLIGHEHKDHCAAWDYFRREGTPVYMTAGTARALNFDDARIIRSGDSFDIGDIRIAPVTVPHDAKEPVQFVFDEKLGIFTDLGHITAAVQNACRNLEAIVLDCNYDAKTLAANRLYPEWLKKRITGKYGHLENETAAALVRAIDSPRLRYVVAAHLSENNNTESSARRALSRVCDEKKIIIAGQQYGTGDKNRRAEWIQLSA